jgi:hypothetical protein
MSCLIGIGCLSFIGLYKQNYLYVTWEPLENIYDQLTIYDQFTSSILNELDRAEAISNLEIKEDLKDCLLKSPELLILKFDSYIGNNYPLDSDDKIELIRDFFIVNSISLDMGLLIAKINDKEKVVPYYKDKKSGTYCHIIDKFLSLNHVISKMLFFSEKNRVNEYDSWFFNPIYFKGNYDNFIRDVFSKTKLKPKALRLLKETEKLQIDILNIKLLLEFQLKRFGLVSFPRYLGVSRRQILIHPDDYPNIDFLTSEEINQVKLEFRELNRVLQYFLLCISLDVPDELMLNPHEIQEQWRKNVAWARQENEMDNYNNWLDSEISRNSAYHLEDDPDSMWNID